MHVPPDVPRVLSRRDALALGMSRHAIDRCLASKRWRRLLPHVFLTVDTLTWPDRLYAALAYAGEGSLLSGAAALTIAEVRCVRRPSRVLVLAPLSSRSRSVAWVHVRSTRRLPEPEARYGPRRVHPARAAADHALTLRRLDDVRTLVAEVIRRGLCTIDELHTELADGPRNGSAHLRRALEDVRAGAASAPEARAARILRRARIPAFEQNARVRLPAGGWYVADFLWRDRRAILEIDSVEYHLDPADWRATMDRHLALTTLGYSVVHRPPSALREPARFAREIAAWLDQQQIRSGYARQNGC